MVQRCHLGMVWLTWLGLPLLAFAAGWRAGVTFGVVTLAVGIVAQILEFLAGRGARGATDARV